MSPSKAPTANPPAAIEIAAGGFSLCSGVSFGQRFGVQATMSQ